MKDNIIFYFSGTGNCLQASKEISKAFSDCELQSMSKNGYQLNKKYDTIGFVYPTYFQGIPLQVHKFISQLNISNDCYVYAITTYGSMAGNALSQVKKLLSAKDVTLDYGAKLVMFSNYVVMYDMSEKVKEKTEKPMELIQPIIEDIKHQRTNKVSNGIPPLNLYYKLRAKNVSTKDKHFSVSDDCTSCGICKKVCPVKNITFDKNNKPVFNHRCEQCVACMQYCPKRAINYKQLTQKRRRYTNPTITHQELFKSNNS